MLPDPVINCLGLCVCRVSALGLPSALNEGVCANLQDSVRPATNILRQVEYDPNNTSASKQDQVKAGTSVARVHTAAQLHSGTIFTANKSMLNNF